MAFATAFHLGLNELLCATSEKHTEILLYFLQILTTGSLGTKNGKLWGIKEAGNWPAEEELIFTRKGRSGITI